MFMQNRSQVSVSLLYFHVVGVACHPCPMQWKEPKISHYHLKSNLTDVTAYPQF
jgi:hypothetical protein